MQLRLRHRGTAHRFFRLALVWLLAAGLGWACPTPGLAISSNLAGSAVGWVVGQSLDGYGLIKHTTDGGTHWQRQGSGQIPDADLNGVFAVDQDYVWAVGGPAGGYGVILRTTDGGAHWLRQGTPDRTPNVQLLCVYAVSRKIAWAVGFQGVILHTTDGGNSWNRQGEGVAPPVLLQYVYARDALNVWVIGAVSGTCGVILHSTDGGASWQRQTYTPRPDILAPNLTCVHGNPPHTVWVVGNGTVMRSTNDGETWVDLTPPDSGLFDFNGVYAVDANTVWLTRDQGGVFIWDGSQWQQQPTNHNGYEILRISALDGETAWTVGGAVSPGIPLGVILFKEKNEAWTAQQSEQVQLADVSFLAQKRVVLPGIFQLLFLSGATPAK